MFLGSTPPAPRMPVTSREGFWFLGIPGGFSEGNPHPGLFRVVGRSL